MAGVVLLEDQIACIEREIGMRERTYPRWVRTGKLTIDNCSVEMGRIQAVLATLKRLRVEQVFVPAQRGPTEASIRKAEREVVLGVVGLHTHSAILVKIGKQLPVITP